MSLQRRTQPPSRNSSTSELFSIPPDVQQLTQPVASTEEPEPSLPVDVQMQVGHVKAGSVRMSQEATVGPLTSPSASSEDPVC